MKRVPMSYTKRARNEMERLREDFSRFDPNAPGRNKMVGERRDFLNDISRPDVLPDDTLRKAGWSDRDIARFRSDQFVPKGWEVHHRFPLDDGGTNESSNLVLLRKDPDHIGLTNEQTSLTQGMNPGDTRTIDFPMPPPGEVIWPR